MVEFWKPLRKWNDVRLLATSPSRNPFFHTGRPVLSRLPITKRLRGPRPQLSPVFYLFWSNECKFSLTSRKEPRSCHYATWFVALRQLCRRTFYAIHLWQSC